MRVREATRNDREWIESFLAEHGSVVVARRGELVRPLDHPMLIAVSEDGPAGLLTYIVDGRDCEILTLHATAQWRGAGTELVAAARDLARDRGCTRLWVLTTNDNVDALRFYQRRRFRLSAVRPGAADEARRTLKPDIPESAANGIPIRDEIELTMELDPQ